MSPDLPSDCLLGPSFDSQNEISFFNYVSSLAVQQILKGRKPKKVKEVVSHNLADDGFCIGCGKKPRKVSAKCPNNLEKDVDEDELES